MEAKLSCSEGFDTIVERHHTINWNHPNSPNMYVKDIVIWGRKELSKYEKYILMLSLNGTTMVNVIFTLILEDIKSP